MEMSRVHVRASVTAVRQARSTGLCRGSDHWGGLVGSQPGPHAVACSRQAPFGEAEHPAWG